MPYIFELMKDYPDIALSEIIELLLPATTKKKDSYVITSEIEKNLIDRLAYVRRAGKINQELNRKSIPEKLSQKLMHESYKVMFYDQENPLDQIEKKQLYACVYNSYDKPVIKLTNPKVIIGIFTTKNKLFITELLFENEKTYMDRRAHLRPKLHPSAISPKLSKAMINMTGIRNGTIYDPFCGTGGILIEALHNNLHAVGSDIERKMVYHAGINIAHEKKKHPNLQNTVKLFVQSALDTTQQADAIVADVPYGKNTKAVKNYKELYGKFLAHIKEKKLTKVLVICFPHFAKPKSIIKEQKFKIKHEHTIYIHQSLQRKVFVLTY